MRFTVYQESNIGHRKMNQDRMGYCFSRDAVLMVLADGMGGHLHGEIAAQIALQTIGSLFQEKARPRLNGPHQFLQASFSAAHLEILRYGKQHDLLETPRTTVVACVIQDDQAYWAHAGDSRLYWMRGGNVLAHTNDHSRVQQMIARGTLQESERETHPERNKLLSCLGGASTPVIEINRKKAALLPGDILLLCSDGLWAQVPQPIICNAFLNKTVVYAIPFLIRLALKKSHANSDNVTALALSYQGNTVSTKKTGVSTQALPIGAFTTTIRVPHSEIGEPLSAFDDAEIERAINEIKTAIQKNDKPSEKK